MTRIIIEIDNKEVLSTTVPPASNSTAPPPELLARAVVLDAMDAGSAPAGVASSEPAALDLSAVDAGPARAAGAPGEAASEQPPKRRSK